jgi:hypothetical protein
MNEKFLLILEKYTAIFFGIMGFVASIFFIKHNDAIVQFWLGGSSVSFIFATVIISFFITLKGIVLTIDHNKYAGLKLLQNHPQEKKRFYKHFDNCIYSSLFIIIINIFYLFTKTLDIYIFDKIFIVTIIGSTFYILSATLILLIILHKIQKYSLDTH